MEENDENYFSLIDVYTCTIDIIVSVRDFSVSTKQFFIDLWIEFYIQLTTISWLSVKNVQRSTKTNPHLTKVETQDDYKLSGLFENIGNLGSVFSFSSQEEDQVHILTEGDLLTKAEERVRLAGEILANNTRARARLAMTDVIRISVSKNATRDVIPEEIKHPEFSILSFLLSWIVDETQEVEDIPDEELLEDMAVDDENSEDDQSFFYNIPEEEHLDLFYIASFLFLTYMIVIILKRNWNYSRKKAIFLRNIKKIKLQQELTSLSTTNPGFMRLNSYH